ncbi:MAG: hypothetical protein IPJ43_14545 [Saprospiraceae bacterium]|nr:hypothetical protein [Saprospiraceae bacterium]
MATQDHFGAGQLFYSNWVIKGDTIVDGKQLQKIYLAGNIRQMDTNCLQFSKFVYADSNRVYFGDRPSNLKLTYDFNLNVGDSFPINSYFDMGNFNYVPTIYFPKVIESSTIIYLGKSRKKIVFTPVWRTTIVWVEGIGDFNYGLDVPYPTVTLFNTFPTRNEFFCFYDGETVQSNGLCLYNNCNSTRVDDESRKIVDYIIYPNPTCTDQINLMTSIQFDCFRIYDSFGKTIPFNLSKGLDQYNF